MSLPPQAQRGDDHGRPGRVPAASRCAAVLLLAHLRPPQPRRLAELATKAVQSYASWRFRPIQSFIGRYVAKFAILACMATVRFLPDKTDHRERADPRREADPLVGTVEAVQAPATSPGRSPVLGGGRLAVIEAEDFHRSLPHLHLPDFAGHCHRELIDDMPVPGNLVVRQLPRTK